MTGAQLKAWREGRGWTQSDLINKLQVTARQTVVRWEQADNIPRMVELSVIALDQVEGCNRRTYPKQLSSADCQPMVRRLRDAIAWGEAV